MMADNTALWSYPNSPQMSREDLEQIYPDDLKKGFTWGKWQFKVIDKFKTGLGYNATSSTAASPAVESFVNSSEMLENQEYNKSKGYHAVPPPYTWNFIPRKRRSTFLGCELVLISLVLELLLHDRPVIIMALKQLAIIQRSISNLAKRDIQQVTRLFNTNKKQYFKSKQLILSGVKRTIARATTTVMMFHDGGFVIPLEMVKG
ncbi:hypothetical protein Tco_0699814 [Tanacetum coccineum]